eukprot:PhM_4_TR17808/c0_g1_i1/m.72420
MAARETPLKAFRKSTLKSTSPSRRAALGSGSDEGFCTTRNSHPDLSACQEEIAGFGVCRCAKELTGEPANCLATRDWTDTASLLGDADQSGSEYPLAHGWRDVAPREAGDDPG